MFLTKSDILGLKRNSGFLEHVRVLYNIQHILPTDVFFFKPLLPTLTDKDIPKIISFNGC